MPLGKGVNNESTLQVADIVFLKPTSSIKNFTHRFQPRKKFTDTTNNRISVEYYHKVVVVVVVMKTTTTKTFFKKDAGIDLADTLEHLLNTAV